jgi:hypothetical protein
MDVPAAPASRLLGGVDIFRRLAQEVIQFSPDLLRSKVNRFSIANLETPLYVVLDEGQVLGHELQTHFVSSGGEHHSFLKHAVTPWRHAPRCIVLVSGTELSVDVVEASVYSPLALPTGWSVFTDTGYFQDKNTHSEYIRRHVWPDRKLDESMQAFLDRAWRWLRGRFVQNRFVLPGPDSEYRHQFTTFFVSVLCDHPQSPHRLLDKYISKMTGGFEACDGLPHELQESELSMEAIDVLEWQLDFSALKPGTIVWQEIRRMVMMFALRANYRPNLGQFQAINLGIARISSPTTRHIKAVLDCPSELDARIDEPLAIAAAFMHFVKTALSDGLKCYTSFNLDVDSQTRGATFEHAVMIILAKVLNGTRTLDDIFDIHRRNGLPGTSLGKVQLVSILAWDRNAPIVCDAGLHKGASPVLGFWARKPEHMLEWLRGCGIPFALPDNNMGPDLWTLVKVGGSLLWLGFQDKCFGAARLQYAQYMDAVRSTTPESFYTDKVGFLSLSVQLRHPTPHSQHGIPFSPKKRPGLPQACKDLMHLSALPVLRVIASFPATPTCQTIEKACTELEDDHGLASLKVPSLLLPPDSPLLHGLHQLRDKLLNESTDSGEREIRTS